MSTHSGLHKMMMKAHLIRRQWLHTALPKCIGQTCCNSFTPPLLTVPPHSRHFSLPTDGNPLAIGGPANIFDVSGKGLVLILEYVFLVHGVPDPELPRNVCKRSELNSIRNHELHFVSHTQKKKADNHIYSSLIL